MRSKIFSLLILISISTFSYRQEINPRTEQKLGFGGQLLGPTLIMSANINYFITHNFNVEIGGGLLGYYGGLKYYFGKPDKLHKWTPYIGAHYTSVALIDFRSSNATSTGIYAPIGIQLMKKGGFTFAPEIAFIKITDNQQTPI